MLAWLKRILGIAPPKINPPVFGPFGVDFLASEAASKQITPLGGSVFCTIGTPSMVPLIPARPTVIAIVPRKLDASILGRVIVYSAPGAPTGKIVHRVVAQYANGDYIAKGDNNPAKDGDFVVTPETLLGEVVGIYLI